MIPSKYKIGDIVTFKIFHIFKPNEYKSGTIIDILYRIGTPEEGPEVLYHIKTHENKIFKRIENNFLNLTTLKQLRKEKLDQLNTKEKLDQLNTL